MADVTGCTEAASPMVSDVEAVKPCPQAKRKWVLVVAILSSALGFIDGSVVTIAVPAIRDGLSASFGEIQWVMNGYLLFLAAFILPAGALGDRFGQRDVIVIGLIVFVLMSILCGLAQTPGQLIAARAAKGMAAALIVPGSMALIAKNFPASERGAAIGLWSGASALTTALGPVIGGLILQLGGEEAWRLIFFLNLPLGGLAVLIALKMIPRDPGRQGASIDYGGGVLSALGLGTLAYALTAISEGTGTSSAVMLIGVFAVMFILFLVVEARRKDPMLPLGLFRSRGFSGVNAMTFLLYLALGGMLFYAPITLIEMHGLGEGVVALTFLPFTAVLALASRWTGGLADRVGLRAPLAFGAVLAGISFLAMGYAVLEGSFYGGVLPAMALLGVGMGFAIPPLGAAVMASVPEERIGIASGVNNTVSRVSQLVAIGGLGLVAALSYRAALPGAPPGLGFAEALPGAEKMAVVRAMGQGFFALTLVSMLLAFLSAAIAWFTQPGGKPVFRP
ncbi:MAG: MFS transporter [Pseudomonadota bacterium]